MEIKLPSTITARYEEDYTGDPGNTNPGDVVLEFGGIEFARIPVTEDQHISLTEFGYGYDPEVYRERELCEIVAKWLGERLGASVR